MDACTYVFLNSKSSPFNNSFASSNETILDFLEKDSKFTTKNLRFLDEKNNIKIENDCDVSVDKVSKENNFATFKITSYECDYCKILSSTTGEIYSFSSKADYLDHCRQHSLDSKKRQEGKKAMMQQKIPPSKTSLLRKYRKKKDSNPNETQINQSNKKNSSKIDKPANKIKKELKNSSENSFQDIFLIDSKIKKEKINDACFSKPNKLMSRIKVENVTSNESLLQQNGFKDVSPIAKKRAKLEKNDKESVETNLYKCKHCGKTFADHTFLIAHLKIHSAAKPYKCAVCGKSFQHNSTLVTHSRTHTGEKPFKCEVCKKSFTQGSTLTGHMRIHTGEKPYKCDVCNKTFHFNSGLASHIKVHHHQPFQCTICKKRFSTKIFLKNHALLHDQKKWFKCSICGKSFGDRLFLKDHKKTHKIVKQITCQTCGKMLKSENNYIKHLQTHCQAIKKKA